MNKNYQRAEILERNIDLNVQFDDLTENNATENFLEEASPKKSGKLGKSGRPLKKRGRPKKIIDVSNIKVLKSG